MRTQSKMALHFSYLLFPFLLYFSLTSFASSDSSFASDQIKLWSENVKNKMPISIFTKLSPLTKQDSVYYSKAISQSNFKADTKFCSLAKLACSTTATSLRNDALFNINYAKAAVPKNAATSPRNDAFGNYAKAAVPKNAATSPRNDAFGNYAKAAVPKNAATSPRNDAFGNYAKAAVPKNDTTPNQEAVVEQVDEFIFFKLSKLREGHTIHLPNLKTSLPLRKFLPAEIAKRISLSPKMLSDIFPESPKEDMATTLSDCAATAIEGEFKACPKSLEEMIGFSKTALGARKLLVLASESTEGSEKEVKIRKVKELNAEKIVACHEMFLPFATYYCHSLSFSRIYSVELVEPKTGAPVNTVTAICHMDTSKWEKNHAAFKVLKFGPGQGEACHWMNEANLAWVAAVKNV